MIVAALGTVLAAGYLLWMLQKTAFGTPAAEFVDDPHIHDVSRHEWVAWAPFLVAIVVFGFYPNLIFDITDPAVVQSLEVEGLGGVAGDCLDGESFGRTCFDGLRDAVSPASGTAAGN